MKEFYAYSQELKDKLMEYHPIVIEVNFEGLRQKNAGTLAALIGATQEQLKEKTKKESEEEEVEPEYGCKSVSCRSVQEVMKWITVKNTLQHEHDAIVAMQADLEAHGAASKWYAGAKKMMEADLGDVIDNAAMLLDIEESEEQKEKKRKLQEEMDNANK